MKNYVIRDNFYYSITSYSDTVILASSLGRKQGDPERQLAGLHSASQGAAFFQTTGNAVGSCSPGPTGGEVNREALRRGVAFWEGDIEHSRSTALVCLV